MFKKTYFSLSLILPFAFALPAWGEAPAAVPMQEAAVIADMPDEDIGGFSGSLELKYKGHNLTGDGGHESSYRARAGWSGAINQYVKWGLGLSSSIEEGFNSYSLKGVHLEHVYASFSPVENFWLKAGKLHYKANHHYTGVLIDEDHYSEGVLAKLYAEAAPGTKVYVKGGVVYNGGQDDVYKHNLYGDEDFVKGWLTIGKVGVKSDVGAAVVHGGAAVKWDGLAEGGGEFYPAVYVNGGADDVGGGVGAGAFAVGGTNGSFDSWTYTGGVYVGSHKPEEANEYSVSVSYFNIEGKSWNAAKVDTDYYPPTQSQTTTGEGEDATTTAGGYVVEDGNGVAVKGQYNVWDDVSLVGKYSYILGDDTQNLVGELTFNF